MRPRLLALALLAAALAGCGRPAGGPAAPTTLVLVRHAEKASEAPEAPLSAAGKKRALALIPALASAGIEAVYASPFRQTQETARPLARRLNLSVEVNRVGTEDAMAEARRFAHRLVAAHPGQTVLVVGHADTVPVMIEALTGRPMEPLEPNAYDNLFIVTVPPGGSARLFRLRYGPPDPATQKQGQTARPRPSREPSRS